MRKFSIFHPKVDQSLTDNFQFSNNKEKGQVALIVLLVSAVVMTLGLSLSRKTVVETKIDTDEEMLRQAFDAAESGVDYFLATQQDKYTAQGVGTTIEADITVNNIGGGNSIDFGEYTISGQPTVFWLVDHGANGDIGTNYYTGNYLNLCVDNSFTGSLKIDDYYLSAGAYRVNRMAHNYGIVPQVITNVTNMTAGVCSGGRKGVRIDFALGTNQLMLAVTPLFQGTRITVEGPANFPSQGMEIVSTGYVGRVDDGTTQLSGVSRRVSVVNRYRVPAFMMEGVSSGGSVVSN